VTVSARAARNVTAPASLGGRDVRAGSRGLAGTYPFEIAEESVTGWHHHDLHQLEYAFEGVAEVETDGTRYLLPPQQAAWIPAETEHCTTLTRVRTLSVFFDPAFFAALGPAAAEAGSRVRILAVEPVIREMVLYARRWPINRPASREPGDPAADAFFAALAHVIAGSLDRAAPLWLPAPSDPLVAAATRYALADLAGATLPGACAAAAASERTLRRAFQAQAGLSWRQYLLRARLLRAMALLCQPGPTVLDVATQVGFASPSGFTRAFRHLTGETPLAYRQRVTSPDRPSSA
jgi:AraC-like DNA-binding protein